MSGQRTNRYGTTINFSCWIWLTTLVAPTIVPGFNMEERVTYVTREIDDIKDLLEDYDDCKLIYEALMDYTLALARLEERQPIEEEQEDLKQWLSKLQELDPMRSGRWIDMEKRLSLR